MEPAFGGFPEEGVKFFRSLERNNRREWFQPRKHIYEEQLKAPMIGLVGAVNAALMRFAPGSVLPDHEHVNIEQTYVLEGALEDEEGACTAGNFVWRPSGSKHVARSKNGALLIAMLLKPNKFLA